jgi:hypothetical protein
MLQKSTKKTHKELIEDVMKEKEKLHFYLSPSKCG